ncbi:HIRAN domain-containing protein [Paracoccus gahaiensis]|nr:HIRAN domain-containing protein [Paracoccus gahaiensis]
MMLGLALTAAIPSAALAGRIRPEPIEVLDTYLANPPPDSRAQVAGQSLRLRRVHDWRFDPAAVAVETEQGQRLGYLPPRQAEVLSRLMDHGAQTSARATGSGRIRVLLHL